MTTERPPPTIAILPWGDAIEDFLETANISLDQFCCEMTGGWLFGYGEALKLNQCETVFICFSTSVSKAETRENPRTGSKVLLLPSPTTHRFARKLARALERRCSHAKLRRIAPLLTILHQTASSLASYLATDPLALARALKAHRVSHLICQEYEYTRFDVCVLLSRLLGIPVFASFQGGSVTASRLESWIRPLTVRWADGLIVAPRQERRRVITTYSVPPSQLHDIPNPLDTELWKPLENKASLREKHGLPPAATIAVWHGRVAIHTKGLDTLLRAWASVAAAAVAEAPLLLLIGNGSDREKLRALIDCHAPESVRWIDRYILDRSHMRELLNSADFYIFPSRREGFPVAPTEAMACGLPVIATTASGVPDIFPHGEASGGILVPPDDSPALARGMTRLLQDPELRKALSANARQQVIQSFSLKSIGTRLKQTLTAPTVPRNPIL
ncbi:glycosyltransferase family 4 protein [Pelagicoccus sp. SDUM812002]|uniref:glycosyltransferase family 4 protein n=1 Tax=Pelagicoccus sp. SDUM812002 TaxID=3041266 RepID=UPI00280D66A1|nr:glycosyltransferase family 4 protein [Pelagicoccus sp. SDUM812002]